MSILDSGFDAVSLGSKKVDLRYCFFPAVLPKADSGLTRATRNLPNLNTMLASNINAFEILKADSVVALKDSLGTIEKTFLKNAK